MTQQERQQLSAIVDRLIEVQVAAPDTVQIVKGRSSTSVSYQLLDIIRDFKGLIDYEPTEATEAETENA